MFGRFLVNSASRLRFIGMGGYEMRYRRTIWLTSALLLASVVEAKAQYYGPTAANFLNYPATPQALAMGEAGVSIVANSAMSVSANPGLLGMQSLDNSLNIGTSLVHYIDSNLPYGVTAVHNYSFLVSAVTYGTRLNSIWHDLPFKAGVGVGYSYEESTLPFAPEQPSVSGYITDYANSFTVGLGVDYFLRVGLGYSMELIKNKNPFSAFTPNIDQPAENFGAVLQIPVLHLLYGTRQRPLLIGKNIYPSLDVTAGYALRNVGGYVIKTPNYQLPIARQASLGWNWKFSLRSRMRGYDWKWFSFTWAREATSEPFNLDSVSAGIGPNGVANYDYLLSYRNGLGAFGSWNNLVLGIPTTTATSIKGWQIGVGGFFYLRGGSITYSGGPALVTSGWGARLDGLVKLVVLLHGLNPNASFTHFVLDHLDLRFDYYGSESGLFPGQPFESLDLVVR